MTIEKRYSKRIEHRIDAHIIHRRRRFALEARNLSSEGMFLATGRLSIPTGNMIDLEFSLGQHRWAISALIIHTQKNGFGVVFCTPQPELLDEINNLQAAAPLAHLPPHDTPETAQNNLN